MNITIRFLGEFMFTAFCITLNRIHSYFKKQAYSYLFILMGIACFESKLLLAQIVIVAPPVPVVNPYITNSAGYNSYGINPIISNTGIVPFIANGGPFTIAYGGTTYDYQSVAKSSTAAPTGGNYQTFGLFTINNTGSSAFYASLTGGTSTGGIFVGKPGMVNTVALQGNVTPSGGVFSSLSPFSIAQNNSGRVAFTSTLSGITATTGVFSGFPGSLQTVALRGSVAPVGGNFDIISSNLVLNDLDQLAFHSTLAGGSATSGIFKWSANSLSAVAIQGQSTPVGGTFNSFSNPSLNKLGQIAFRSNISGGSVTNGIFIETSGTIQKIATTQETIPSGGNIGSFNGSIHLNNSGQITFRANLINTTTTEGIFVATTDSIHEIALAGNPAPGGGFFSSFTNTPIINKDGLVAFTASLTGPGISVSNDNALFVGLPGNLARVISEGDIVDFDPGSGILNLPIAGINLRTDSNGQDGRGMSFSDNGQLVYLNTRQFSNGIFTSQVTIIPEPSSVILSCVSIILIAIMLKRK